MVGVGNCGGALAFVAETDLLYSGMSAVFRLVEPPYDTSQHRNTNRECKESIVLSLPHSFNDSRHSWYKL